MPDAFHAGVNIAEDAQTVLADPSLLEQILVNCLENSVKYAPVGSAIAIAARREDALVVISVADEGIGIEADDLQRVFDRFFRAERGIGSHPAPGWALRLPAPSPKRWADRLRR